jgi:RNA polymerase sigma factor for flagellar operon FliA
MSADYEERERLWDLYAENQAQSVRDGLAVAYVPLVRFVAARVKRGLPPQVELDELTSYGFFGLIEAIDRFDPKHGTKFETYAIPRIRGAILDELRKLDWFPRSVRALARKVEAARSTLELELLRGPTPAELADALEMDQSELEDALAKIDNADMVPLDATRADEDSEPTSVVSQLVFPGDEDAQSAVERKQFIRRISERICALPERERIVLTLLYYERLDVHDVGEVLNISDARVGQLHHNAVLGLRG